MLRIVVTIIYTKFDPFSQFVKSFLKSFSNNFSGSLDIEWADLGMSSFSKPSTENSLTREPF
jgi:hypothetical protein